MEVLHKEEELILLSVTFSNCVDIQDVQSLDLNMVLSLPASPKLLHLLREQMLSPAYMWLKHMAMDLQVRRDINKIHTT